LALEGRLPDTVSVYQWLKDKGRLEDAGGLEYVTRLPDVTPSPANFENYWSILRDKAARREVLRVSTLGQQLAFDESRDLGAGALEFAQIAERIVANGSERREWLRFHTPSQCTNYKPPEGLVLSGDFHVVRGVATVLGGPPGVGKSRVALALAIAGGKGPGSMWLNLPIKRRFKTLILQNENGLHRLKLEFSEIGAEGLDESIKVSAPPPFGMAFGHVEFRMTLAEVLDGFKPDLFIFDPWNSAAQDDTQRDYLHTYQLMKDILPKGDYAPAVLIVAHTRKPKVGERANGRNLLNLLAGSYVLGSIPRSVFILQPATDDPTDDRVVWTCCKNNDGPLGDRTAWHRRNGLFVPCEDFEWTEFDNPEGEGRRTVTQAHMEKLFENSRRLERKHAAQELQEISGLKHSACYNALSLSGRFSAHLKEDPEGLLYWLS
jgi:hypothetical protein